MVLKNYILIKKNKISYILKKKTKNGLKKSIVFLCGYRSDKNGKKADFIEKLRKDYGFEYLRFDYSGHGESSGDINNLCMYYMVESYMLACLSYCTTYKYISITFM